MEEGLKINKLKDEIAILNFRISKLRYAVRDALAFEQTSRSHSSLSQLLETLIDDDKIRSSMERMLNLE